MTTMQPRPDVMIRVSTLTRGGWECWACGKFTPFECFVITHNGPRWLPCCTVECYRQLPAAYERFAISQSQANGVLFPLLNERPQQQATGATMMKRFWRWLRQFRGYGFAANGRDER